MFASAIVGAAALMVTPARATVLLEYNAATAGAGVEPNDVGWSVSTNDTPAMTNNGTYLLQDKTGVSGQQYGEYLSPSLAAGTFTRGGADYGIEFGVRPITDAGFNSTDWGEMYLTWSDDQFIYNITVDKYGQAATSGTNNGEIAYGKNSYSPAISGIDWTNPHTVFIGHRGNGTSSVFDFYLDGSLVSTITDGSIARTGSYARDAIGFGDGTQGTADVAGEWYFVRVYDVNAPIPEPASLGLLLGSAGLMLGRRRRRI
jgi:hypothetical protein